MYEVTRSKFRKLKSEGPRSSLNRTGRCGAQPSIQPASQLGVDLFCSSLDPRNTSKLAKLCSGAPAKAPVSVDQQMQFWTLSPRALTWLARSR